MSKAKGTKVRFLRRAKYRGEIVNGGDVVELDNAEQVARFARVGLSVPVGAPAWQRVSLSERARLDAEGRKRTPPLPDPDIREHTST